MEFTSKFNELKGLFSLNKKLNIIENSQIEIQIHSFSSMTSLAFPFEDVYDSYSTEEGLIFKDDQIKENKYFTYPVFVPRGVEKASKAIILMHGLNEKSWNKYLPWAYYLAEKTNRPVILFPISFHMNRCPDSWANPRAMMPLLDQRQKAIKLSDLTFANVALSERLTENPLRFFRSGRQSAEDIVDLLQTIKQGKHQLFEPNTQVDFFAYSIGAFLAQILFLANPKNLLYNSKLFLFCGGARFSEMFGTSRLIMDSQAFISLRKYYLGDFLNELKTNSPFSQYIMKSQLGNAFQAMLAPDSLKSFREDMLQKLSHQVRVIALKKDKVIPARFIQSTFSCIKHKVKGIVEVFDFPYNYSHEMPFPILSSPSNLQVDQSFERVFNSAAEFLK
jgi:pimeloyl-ACP methyl ester carboxylesterase